MGTMKQPRKASFARFLSGFGPAESCSDSEPSWTGGEDHESIPASLPEQFDDVKGSLGLTTLYEPVSPTLAVADIVFIHGLGGGSRKTWSHSKDAAYYWPQYWLPADAEFTNVRIHTFGYRADWGSRQQSIMHMRDFGQSLLGELRNHPSVRRASTRIILVGHSMGGCVAKMVYILAREDPTASALAARVHSIFFLGTPHRGSNLASTLESILAVGWAKKPFVTDLRPNSIALESINDSFRHVAPDLQLWSFYETLPTPIPGLSNRIVVERYSATLGYHNEEITAMDADHRHVCKFSSTSDPNYKILRNALVTALDMIRSSTASVPKAYAPYCGIDARTVLQPTARSISRSQINQRIRAFLGVQSLPEDDLAALQVLKHPGSCQWFTEKRCFVAWRDETSPVILWLIGRPGAGKSVLASHVIQHLHAFSTCCSYFYFKHAKTGKSTLSDCFRSLAYQMAMQDTSVLDALLQLADDDLPWDQNDDATVWRRLFTKTLFDLPSVSSHYWVIDGIDECANYNVLFTKKLLSELPDGLRMFATSRSLDQVERGVASLGSVRAHIHMLSDTDTLADMRAFLTTRATELGRFESDEDLKDMCDRVLRKSNGLFLWVRLVLQEFGNVWTAEAMDASLREVPAGLQSLYSRMVQSMEMNKRDTPLAKSILTWATLASRPLTVDEIRCAVKLDVNQTLQDVSKAIPGLCGQLVFVDQDNKVHLIHETVREFLLAEDLGEQPVIIQKEGHTYLARLLLRYLSSGVLKPRQAKTQQAGGRTRGFAKPVSSAPPIDLSLVDYASGFFSEHLYWATSENDELMVGLQAFMKDSAILSWMEYVARTGNLSDISRTATNIREWLIRRTKYVSPMEVHVQLADSWVTDLIRVAAKFRTQLLACPSSIHCLIPPLCPPNSIMARTFAKHTDRPSLIPSGLVVKGLPAGSWDDCLARLEFQKGLTTTVSHGVRFFAVGLSTGHISLYDSASVQCLLRLMHPERVKLLQFGQDDVNLASCGTKHLAVWDSKSGAQTHLFNLQSAPLGISFLGGEELICAFQSSELGKWTLETGECASISWKDTESDMDLYDLFSHKPQGVIPLQPPSRVAFLLTSTDDLLLAVGYRAHPIFVWDALELQLLGLCDPGVENNGIDAMVFNPNSDIPALVVSYQDGTLCVFDYGTMELQFCRPRVYACSMACSPDGRTLVTGTGQGLIELFGFKRGYSGVTTLSLIYRTNHPLDSMIRGITFSSDGLRFIDVHGRQGRVWEPAALVRKNTSEVESSAFDSAPGDTSFLLPPRSAGLVNTLEDSDIRSPLVAASDGEFVVAGNSEGEVILFSTADAKPVGILYKHHTSVVGLALGEARNLVVSADDAGRVLVAELRAPLARIAAMPQQERTRIVLDRRFGGAIARVLVSPGNDRLLVSGRHADEMWEVPSGTVLGEKRQESPAAKCPLSEASTTVGSALERDEGTLVTPAATLRSAFQHPGNQDWFVVITGDIARIYAWADFAEQTPSAGLVLERSSTDINWSIATASYHAGSGFVVELLRPSPSSLPLLHLWPAAELDPSRSSARPATEPNLETVRPAVSDVLGMTGPSTLAFIDVNLWICTVELQSPPSTPGGAAPRAGSIGSLPMVSSTRPTSSALPRRPGSWAPTAAAAAATTTTSSSVSSVSTGQAAHARRHFFALSEWRADGPGGGKLRCTLASPSAPAGLAARAGSGSGSGGRDVVFAAGHHLVVVKGGLEFSEAVHASAAAPITGGRGPTGGSYAWDVVSGSMHRRASAW